MSITQVEGEGLGEFLMPEFWEEFDFNIHANGFWEFVPTGESGSFPTPYFQIPGIFTEQNCEEFMTITFSGPLDLYVSVECYLGGKDDTPDSQVYDQFLFENGTVSQDGVTSSFFRQYICRERTAGEEDPCKGGPTSPEPPVKTL